MIPAECGVFKIYKYPAESGNYGGLLENCNLNLFPRDARDFLVVIKF
jgi:hypothetical protein